MPLAGREGQHGSGEPSAVLPPPLYDPANTLRSTTRQTPSALRPGHRDRRAAVRPGKHPRRRWADVADPQRWGTCAALNGSRMLWARERRATRARRASESSLPATRAGDVTRRDPRQETRPPQPEVGDPPVTAVTVTRLGPDDPSAAPAPGRRCTNMAIPGPGKVARKSPPVCPCAREPQSTRARRRATTRGSSARREEGNSLC